MNVLVVEDDEDIRSLIGVTLEETRMRVHQAGTGAEAIALASRVLIDLVVLDRNLPDTTGLALLDELRALHPSAHVLMLTGAASIDDRVLGLASGADDYMVKPFAPRELAARVPAVARRSKPQPTVIRLGDLTIDPSARSVTVRGDPVMLTRREFDVLLYLATNAGHVVSRDELLRAVWSSSSDWQTAATVTEHVRRLRTKLERDPSRPTLLVTSRGTGYRLTRE
jgi:DNA-binding response OmpR family regulator